MGPRTPSATPAAGRAKARRRYAVLGMCERCGLVPAEDRHHVDGDPQNNERTNVVFLCTRCHMAVDGRLGTRPTRPMIAAANQQRRDKTHCVHGHPLSGDNLRITPQGWRICRECVRTRSRERMRRKRGTP